jgi:hypothetical protein
MSRNGTHARLLAPSVPLVDTFALFGTPSPLGTIETPSTARFEVEWAATGAAVPRGSGASGPPAEAFLGEFAPARAVGSFSGSELGFAFSTQGRVTSDTGYAEVGTERNGSFL